MGSFNEHVHFLEDAFKAIDCQGEEEVCFLMTHPAREITTQIPLRKTDGSIKVYKGMRVQHNDALGPFKGGLRYCSNLSLEHLRVFSSLMTWKTSLANLPLGGAKGGIDCDPTELKEYELEKLTKDFTATMKKTFGPELDIPAPDMGTDEKVMSWLLKEYNASNGHCLGVVTGKPVELGGLAGRTEATGLVLSAITSWFLLSQGKQVQDTTIAIQGFGNVGSHAALYLHREGAKIVAVSDRKGAVFKSDGLDIETLFKLKNGSRDIESVIDIHDGGIERISNKELLSLKVDLLMPAAQELVITKENADSLKCHYLIEAANFPLSYEADRILREKEIKIVPDVLANNGGVIASYYEWCQNHQKEIKEKDKTLNSLLQHSHKIYSLAHEMAQERNIELREACYQIAIERVRKAIYYKGF